MPVSKNRRKNKNKKKKMPVKVKKKAAVASSSPLPDRRTLEKMMAQITAAAASPDMFASGSLGGDGLFDDYADNKDPLWQAQELMYEAWEAGTKRDRIALAKQALALSDLCADAYVLLAEEAAKNIIEEKNWYELAVEAGRKALGEELFEDGEGDFAAPRCPSGLAHSGNPPLYAGQSRPCGMLMEFGRTGRRGWAREGDAAAQPG